MCTVLLRFAPGSDRPVLLGAVRDEFADRPWDPPGTHWDGPRRALVGGRDRTAGGTWLAVDPSSDRPAIAALLNGVRRPPLPDRTRPTRGTLALDALATGRTPDHHDLTDYDGFHLLVATSTSAQVWSWNAEALHHRSLAPGDHIVVNLGVDAADDPLVPHFAPLLHVLPDPLLTNGADSRAAWEPWTDLLDGDGLDPSDPRALVVRREIDGRTYRSTSATLIALADAGVRYEFSTEPSDPFAWRRVPLLIRR